MAPDLPHLRSLLRRCLLSNGRSHLQGYTEEKVQKFRQLVRLFCDEPKGQQKFEMANLGRKLDKCDS